MTETLISPEHPAVHVTPAPQRPRDVAPGATILVCDDQVDIVEMLVSVLEMEGFTPLMAYCGADALRIVQQHPVDLVLLDKALPDIDGFEVCHLIKEMFPLRFLPVILVTAKAHKQDKLAGLQRGADDYITKPFDLEELLAKARVMLRIKRVEDQLYQRNIELASFNAVAGVIGESLILEDMLHNSLREILRLMDVAAGWIFLLDESSGRFDLAVCLGNGTVSASANGLSGTSLDWDPHAVATRHDGEWLAEGFRAQQGLRSCVAIPLKSKGRTLGVMTLASRHDAAFQPHGSDLQVLESLGFELGVAVEHALLYQDARAMVERLQEMDRLKSHFISTASHEFRTPLSIIKGFANLLKRKEDFGFDTATEKQYLGLIDGQINALANLVDDMLNASRIESGHVDVAPEDLDLAALVDGTALPIALQAQDRGITVALDVPAGLHAFADRGHVEQILSNLLSNAVKYSDDGTAVTVSARSAGGMAQISVQDHGVGIAAEQMPRLFERFTRLENRRSVEAGGTGLGLYIARNWVEANGGRIWAQSTAEQGSTFCFTLPLRA